MSEDIRARRWASFKASHPDRAAVIEDTQARIANGELIPQLCEICGDPTPPAYDWKTPGQERFIGWRPLCWKCKTNEANRAE